MAVIFGVYLAVVLTANTADGGIFTGRVGVLVVALLIIVTERLYGKGAVGTCLVATRAVVVIYTLLGAGRSGFKMRLVGKLLGEIVSERLRLKGLAVACLITARAVEIILAQFCSAPYR